MAHVKQVHAEKISVPAGTPGLGTVTNVGTALPITGGPITDTGTIGFNNWPADAAGILENDGAGGLSWNTQVGQFVHLQASTPGTPDTGNFNVSGTGVIATQLRVGPPIVGPLTATILVPTTGQADADDVIRVLKPDDSDGFIVYADSSAEINVDSPSDGLTLNIGPAAGYGITVVSTSSNQPAIAAFASDQSAAYFTSSYGAGNAFPTVVIQQDASGTANLLNFTQGDNAVIGQFNPVGARLGLGDLPGLPDTMLHLYGGNTFTGSAAAIIQNDSQTDASQVTKLCFADTNTATTLSNACIVFETVAGAAGDLAIFTGGADNDTPGTDSFHLQGSNGFLGLGATGQNTTISSRLTLFDAAADQTSITIENDAVGGSGHGISGIDLLSPGQGTSIYTGDDDFVHFTVGHGFSNSPDWLKYDINAEVVTFTGPSVGDQLVLDNNNDSTTFSSGSQVYFDGSGVGVAPIVRNLHVADGRTAGVSFSVTNTANTTSAATLKAIAMTGAVADIVLGVGSADSIHVVGATGFVGINTPAPAHALDVTGDAQITTNLFLTGVAAAAGAPGLVYADPVTHILKVSV